MTDFAGKTKLQWDYVNDSLRICEEGEVWSLGGVCSSSSRTVSMTSDPSSSFSLTNTGEYSFVMWFKMENAIESATLLEFNGGETQI